MLRGGSAGQEGRKGPRCYWTVKQKSLNSSVAVPVVKLRPIVTACWHPLRTSLRRALAVLVTDTRKLVLQQQPNPLPMWQLHAGTTEWMKQLPPGGGEVWRSTMWLIVS